jgi:CheY-like chemotaxis protein
MTYMAVKLPAFVVGINSQTEADAPVNEPINRAISNSYIKWYVFCLVIQPTDGKPFRAWKEPGMKILVVDDTRIILSVIEAILTRDHEQVVTAPDGRAGTRAFYNVRPDLVITDIEMPWRDGLSMMQAIRKTHPAVYTIYMTGNPGPYHQDLMEEQRRYAAGILNKPFTRSDLQQAVNNVVAQASHARGSLRSMTLPWSSNDRGADRLAGHSGTPLCAARFRREGCYATIDRGYPDNGGFDRIRTGSGR